MTEVCNIVLTNALLAVGLAIVVGVVCQRIHRPAIRHLLWLLVIIRLMVPPIWVVDFTPSYAWLRQHVLHPVAMQQAELQVSWRSQYQAMQKATEGMREMLPVRTLFDGSIDASKQGPENEVAVLPQVKSWSGLARHVWRGTQVFLFAAWLLGMMVCLAFQIAAVLRFRRQIQRDGYRSRIWQQRVERLAQRFGLSHAPRVLLVRAAISPMLWGLGSSAQILLPDRLMQQLDHRSQDGLIYHELAHYQRGDHWVRLLESLALIVYWWHPVYWWTRHEISKAEEQCCDLLAIRHTCGDRRTYAEALLKTLDFVSSTTYLPAATGAVQGGLLRIRIRQIMAKRKQFSRGPQMGPGVLLAFAAALLPFPCISWTDISQRPYASVASIATPSSTAELSSTSDESYGVDPTKRTHDVADALVEPITQEGTCQLRTDAAHRVQLHAENGTVIDFGVGRVVESAWSTDSDRVAVGTADGVVEVYCSETGERQTRVTGSAHAISRVQFSPNGTVLIIANRMGQITVADANDGRQLLRIRRPHAHPLQIAFDCDEQVELQWTDREHTCQETLQWTDGRWRVAHDSTDF